MADSQSAITAAEAGLTEIRADLVLALRHVLDDHLTLIAAFQEFVSAPPPRRTASRHRRGCPGAAGGTVALRRRPAPSAPCLALGGEGWGGADAVAVGQRLPVGEARGEVGGYGLDGEPA